MSYDSIELTLSRVGEQLPGRVSPPFKPRRVEVDGRCATLKAIKREPASLDGDGVDNPKPQQQTAEPAIMEVSLMKSAFSIFVLAAVLLGSSSAQAARNSNLILPPPAPISTTPPQTNPIGGFVTGPSFGALPGSPGSPTYDPNAALPSLGNSGSALAPSAGTSSSGINTPSTGTSSGM